VEFDLPEGSLAIGRFFVLIEVANLGYKKVSTTTTYSTA
jgi:hypothetical protein